MAKRPGVIVHGTAADLAADSGGYVSSGEGQYSRRSANPPVTMVGYESKRQGRHTVRQLIRWHTSQLAKLRGEILMATDPTRLVKLQKNFDIKTRFVAKLRNENES
jgi:hypothetical protein